MDVERSQTDQDGDRTASENACQTTEGSIINKTF